MIITTTPSVEGRAIREYKGIAFGEVITGVNFMKDLGAGLRNFFGGRSAGYEEELQKARGEALAELEQRAGAMGANAVIIAYEEKYLPLLAAMAVMAARELARDRS